MVAGLSMANESWAWMIICFAGMFVSAYILISDKSADEAEIKLKNAESKFWRHFWTVHPKANSLKEIEQSIFN